MNAPERGTRKSERGTHAALAAIAVGLCAAVGCQQRMADQPAHRPYEVSKMFEFGQSARPLEKGVVHRNQPLSDDPIVTWLSEKGKAPTHTDVYRAVLRERGKTTKAEDGVTDVPGLSAAEVESLLASPPPLGTPTDVDNYVTELPFTPTKADFDRGQVLFNANCALCHGAAGHADGKIPERGFLRPPSYHTDPTGVARDWSKYAVRTETDAAGNPVIDPKTNQAKVRVMGPDFTGNPRGTSRGFYKCGVVATIAPTSAARKASIKEQLKLTGEVQEVPVGYIFQVITWGYGGMASHETQIPDPADRWRVVAYIRALQLSQGTDLDTLPAAEQKKAKDALHAAPAADAHHAGETK